MQDKFETIMMGGHPLDNQLVAYITATAHISEYRRLAQGNWGMLIGRIPTDDPNLLKELIGEFKEINPTCPLILEAPKPQDLVELSADGILIEPDEDLIRRLRAQQPDLIIGTTTHCDEADYCLDRLLKPSSLNELNAAPHDQLLLFTDPADPLLPRKLKNHPETIVWDKSR